MGEVVASIELENAADRGIVSQGLRDESTVRRTTVEGVVDTSAVMLMLSENVVGRLGLERQREVAVTYADERKETRPVAGPLTIRIGNRFMNTDCIVGPPLSEPLIGQIVLEALDLVANCTNHTLLAAAGITGQPPAQAEVAGRRQAGTPLLEHPRSLATEETQALWPGLPWRLFPLGGQPSSAPDGACPTSCVDCRVGRGRGRGRRNRQGRGSRRACSARSRTARRA